MSNFVKRFLPTPEDVGLTRFDRTSQPERYPCTKTEFAALLPTDKTPETMLIRPLLSKTNLEVVFDTLSYTISHLITYPYHIPSPSLTPAPFIFSSSEI